MSCIIKVDNVKSKIDGLAPNYLNLLAQELTVKVPNYYFSPAFKSGRWDGKQHFLTRPANIFPTGLLPKVADFLVDTCEVTPLIEDCRENLEELVLPTINLGYTVGENKELRQYQVDAVNSVATNTVLGVPFQRGVINIATNGGKTVIAEGVIGELYPQLKKCEGVFLFATHSKEIAYQVHQSIENDLQIDVGFIGDGQWDVKTVTVAIITTVYRRMKDGKPEFDELKNLVRGLVVDECLPGTSQVLLPGNKKMSIKDVCERDDITEVVSFNLEKKVFEVKPILRKIVTPVTNPFWKIWYRNPVTQQMEGLMATPNHKIWTSNRGYVRVDELQLGDIIKVNTSNPEPYFRPHGKFQCPFCGKVFDSSGGLGGHVKKFVYNHEVQILKISQNVGGRRSPFKYNLEIADNHNYFANNVLVSNCHHVPANSFSEVFNQFTNASIRLGLTGTVDKKNPVNEMKLYSCTGSILTKISNNFLIQHGVSAKPICIMFQVTKPELGGMEYQDAYRYGIIENEIRHDIIYDICAKETADNNTVLILVERIEHGQHLEQVLKPLCKEVYFTNGQLSSGERVVLLDKLKKGELDVLISSNILDEGVDVSGINAIVYARGMKSMRKLLQGIGRGLRLKDDNSKLRFYDFIDDTHMKLLLHSQERYETLAAEKFVVKLMDVQSYNAASWDEINRED